MARAPRSRARRGVSVRGERRTVRSPVSGPVAESTARIQHLGTHPGAPSDTMRSSLVPSSGVEVQSEMQPGCLADGLDVHQPVCMGFQLCRTDCDILTLAELDATQQPESNEIGASNLQTVFPLGTGSQSSARTHASRFQSDESLASVLSCGAGNPSSNALYAAPTASRDDFPAALCRGPEVISPQPLSFPFGQWHQQSSRETLTNLDEDAPFHSSSSNERCAMEYSAGYPPPPNSNVITDMFPNIVEAAPTTWIDNAILFLELTKHIRCCENEIRMLEQNLMRSQQLVAALCNLDQSLNDMDGFSCMDVDQDWLALNTVYLYLIQLAACQRN